MGCMDTRPQRTGILEQGHVLPSLELQRNLGRMARPDFFTRIPTKQNCSNMFKHHNYSILHQSHGRQYQGPRHGCSTNTPTSPRYEHKNHRFIHNMRHELAGWSNQFSRFNSTYEWKLHPNLFRLLDSYWGPHQIDRFAFMMTAQVPRFNSLYWYPLTSGVNALAQTDCSLLNNYVNAPFSLLPKVKDTVIQQQATATVITPLWSGQVWFQKLQSLKIDSPIPLPVSARTVLRIGPRAKPLKKQRLASICLENLWKTRLRCLGWSRRASIQATHSLAQSTIKTYNSYINKNVEFCQSRDLDFLVKLTLMWSLIFCVIFRTGQIEQNL